MCEYGIILSEYDFSIYRFSSVMCQYGVVLLEYDNLIDRCSSI